jgi:hypothetical protein
MWDKGLAAAVTEAITTGKSEGPPAALPDTAAVLAFIAPTTEGKLHEAAVGRLASQRTRDGAAAMDIVTTSSTGGLLHRNILAK